MITMTSQKSLHSQYYRNKKLLVAPGIATRNPGIATSGKDATSMILTSDGALVSLLVTSAFTSS